MIWWFKPSTVAPGNFSPKHCNLLRIISFLKHHWWWIHQLLMLCFLAIVIFLLLYFPWQYYFENCFWSGNILLFFIFTPFSCFYIESVSNLLAFLLLIDLCLLEVFNKVNSIEGAFSITGVNIGVSEKLFRETVKLRSTSSNDSTFYFIRVFVHVDFTFYFLIYDESINVIL